MTSHHHFHHQAAAAAAARNEAAATMTAMLQLSSSPTTTTATATTTTPTEALVVEALTSMVEQQSPPPPLPPAVGAVSAQQSSEPPIAAHAVFSNSTPLVAASAETPHLVTSPPHNAAAAAAASLAPMCLPIATSSTTTTATAVDETPPPPSSSSASSSSLSYATPPTASSKTATTSSSNNNSNNNSNSSRAVKPILPVKERQPPKPLTRKQRRRALTAPTPRPCLWHKPTLRELQSTTFANYVQRIVLGSAVPVYEDESISDSSESDSDGSSDDSDSGDNGTIDGHGESGNENGNAIHDDVGDEKGASSAAAATKKNKSSNNNKAKKKKKRADNDKSDDVDSMPDEDWKVKPMPLAEGIAKISLPDGFWPTESTSWTQGDRTGRGEAWQAGTNLGDYPLEAPIAQHVRGLAGVYEFSFVDKPPLTLAQFRTKADEYRTQLVGCAYDVFRTKVDQDKKKKKSIKANKDDQDNNKDKEPQENNDMVSSDVPLGEEPKPEENTRSKAKNVFDTEEERLEYLERYFWKRLGPTMPPAWYGADHEGTLFPEDDDATGWSLGQLDSCLHVLPKVPGVTSPYLYAGMWASVFCAHSEDMNLLSINYLHAGAPKLWYAIAPGPDAQRFESLCASSFAGTPSTMGCKEFLRHKRSLLSPKVLLKAGIKFTTAIQRPGDAIITFPAGYHFGFNTGFNLAEATNFAVPEWIPYGLQARVCLCRPDSVRIDMNRLTSLLEEFEQDQSRWRRKRLSWKEWSAQKYAKRPQAQEQRQLSRPDNRKAKKKKKKVPLSEQQRKGEFWIEVVKPLTRSRQANTAPKKEKAPPKSQPEEAGRGKRKRKLTAKAAKWEREQQRKKAAAAAAEAAAKAPTMVVEEIWHLARPLPPRKAVHVGLRVLCLLPGTTMGYAPKNSWRAAGGSFNDPKKDLPEEDPEEDDNSGRKRKHVTDDEEELEEQCFTGQLVEISDDFARVHIDGLPRTEDVWMDFVNSNKVFLDGGRWDEEEAQNLHGDGRSLPQLHYWEVMDSKRRCTE